ncbi:unnamed protein product [Rhodiola kirilowii]
MAALLTQSLPLSFSASATLSSRRFRHALQTPSPASNPTTKNDRKTFPTINAKLELMPLPYPLNGLEPYMSSVTLEYHWGKHHRSYVENLSKQIDGTDLDGRTLEDILSVTYNKGDLLPPFNNAGQIWNHNFFWESMKPGGGGKPTGKLLELIERDFGSFDIFVKEFKSVALSQFGSGWAWLAYKANRLNVENAVNPQPEEKDKKLVIVKSPNAVNPLIWDYSPLLTIDVWEHAYYLDFENRRTEYISTFMEKLVSWEAVSSRLEAAIAKAEEREREEATIGQDEDKDHMENTQAAEMFLDSENEES